jgi:ElaB/YqjD/DUF883 family membrane-anchored ribosome-binding protein
MDSMNNRTIREYAVDATDTGVERSGGAGVDPYPAQEVGSIGTMGQVGGPSDIGSTGTLQGSSASSGSATVPESGTTGAKPSRRKKQSSNSSAISDQVEQKADAVIQKPAEGLKKAADMTRSMTEERSGSVGAIGSQAADVLEKGADYLEQGDTEQMIQDLEAMVRRRPVESLLVAAGAGFLLSKALR